MAIVSIVCATGQQGLAQICRLFKSGYEVRALSRSQKPNLGKYTDDVKVRHIDLTDADTLDQLCRGQTFCFITIHQA